MSVNLVLQTVSMKVKQTLLYACVYFAYVKVIRTGGSLASVELKSDSSSANFKCIICLHNCPDF